MMCRSLDRRRAGRLTLVLAMSVLAMSVLALSAVPSLAAAEIEKVSDVVVIGSLAEAKDLSAVTRVADFLVLASDENARLQFLVRQDTDRYRLSHAQLLNARNRELDFEALAADGTAVYVLGSHSAVRKSLKSGSSRQENLARLATIEHPPERDVLFRLQIDPSSGRQVGASERIDLRPVLTRMPVLAPFLALPGKENGVDLEGLAWRRGELYVGFRGPVLRDNLVPVMVLAFDRPQQAELRYVSLDGRGVRSLAAVEGGFLLVAGAVGDGDQTYQLYFWNGEDCLPASDVAPCRLRLLGEMPVARRGKAEAIEVLRDSADGWELIVFHDGVDGGAPVRLKVGRPPK